MAVFRWGHNWGGAFHDIEREFDRLLESVNLTFHGFRLGRQFPPVNLYELEDHYLLTAELPGVRTDDLELTIANGVLTIKSSRYDSCADDEHYRRQERPQGKWQRSLSLPDCVQDDGMSAELTNGVLRVRLPKAEAAQPRQIQVHDGNELS